MTKPITPDEIADRVEELKNRKAKEIPGEVFEAFNELIVEKWYGGGASVLQKDAIKLIMDKLGCPKDMIFDNHWLDIEYSYRKAGWKVRYDKPGFNETYEPSFIFERSKK